MQAAFDAAQYDLTTATNEANSVRDGAILAADGAKQGDINDADNQWQLDYDAATDAYDAEVADAEADFARLTLANQEWEVRAGQVYLIRRGVVTDRTYWLMIARNLATGEVKYFLSNAPATESIERLLRVAFCR